MSNLKGNSPFMKKIPPGAEVNNVLVGEVDFLDKPVSAFVRLSKAVVLGDFAEVRLPSRFFFVLLGPKVLLTTKTSKPCIRAPTLRGKHTEKGKDILLLLVLT